MTMKYLCIVHADSAVFESFTPEFGQKFNDESLEYDTDLQRRGKFIAAEALQGPEAAVVIRVRDGKMSSTDGPFTELREQVCGFVLIEAVDLNDAIQIAAGIPMARIGTIEVRPVLQFDHS
jgi:hypothetical protein